MPGQLILLINSSTHGRLLVVFLYVILGATTAHPSAPIVIVGSDTDAIVVLAGTAHRVAHLLLVLLVLQDLLQGTFLMDFVVLLGVVAVRVAAVVGAGVKTIEIVAPRAGRGGVVDGIGRPTGPIAKRIERGTTAAVGSCLHLPSAVPDGRVVLLFVSGCGGGGGCGWGFRLLVLLSPMVMAVVVGLLLVLVGGVGLA